MKKIIIQFFTFALTLLSLNAFASLGEDLIEFQTHDGYTLRGKLSYPQGVNHKVPGVLLIHGSGQTDMNLWIPATATADQKPHKMFEVIAHSLSQTGVAVYRYNKRGVTDTPEGPPSIDPAIRRTTDVSHLVADVKSALRVLRSNPRVDTTKIFLLGLSEGTLLAPLVTLTEQNIAGLILLSSMGRNLRETLYFQYVERGLNIAKSLVDINHDGFLVPSETNQFPELSFPMEILDRNQDGRVSMPELNSVLINQFYTQIEKGLNGPSGNWYKEHFALPSNSTILSQYNGPILLLHGEIDAQTPIEELFFIEDRLKSVGHTNYTIQTFKGLGHGFSPHLGSRGLTPTIGPISPTVLQSINLWLHQQLNW